MFNPDELNFELEDILAEVQQAERRAMADHEEEHDDVMEENDELDYDDDGARDEESLFHSGGEYEDPPPPSTRPNPRAMERLDSINWLPGSSPPSDFNLPPLHITEEEKPSNDHIVPNKSNSDPPNHQDRYNPS